MEGKLVLRGGREFRGKLFGCVDFDGIRAEVVFQTGMVGYPESLTDPSYCSQILVLTYPLIGNYGIPEDVVDEWGLSKRFESSRVHISGLVVGEYNEKYSHWTGEKSLGDWMNEYGVVGLSGIDTRELTKILRENGTMRGEIVKCGEWEIPGIEDENPDVEFPVIKQIGYGSVEKVLVEKEEAYYKLGWEQNSDGKCVMVIDCGVKMNQLRSLLNCGMKLLVVKATEVSSVVWSFFGRLLEGLDGVFISNGPGNPKNCGDAISFLRVLMSRHQGIPVFGICLGHQILSLAAGFETYKMKYGNRGHNIPAVLCGTKRCFITSQNHGYAVKFDESVGGWKELFVNANDGSNEGIISTDTTYFSVQFHPEAKGGPNDTGYLFNVFATIVNKDTLSAEKMSEMIYSPWLTDVKKFDVKKVLVLGSGGLSIGQAGEFDYSGSQAIKSYKEEGIETVLINPNIATVQTSKGLADKIYYLPVTPHFVKEVIAREKPDAIALSFGGQTALNCGVELFDEGVIGGMDGKSGKVRVLGTPVEAIKTSEDRSDFKDMLLSIDEKMAPSECADNVEEAVLVARRIGYPVLVRAAFALGGLGSGFAHNDAEVRKLVGVALCNSSQVIIDKSLRGWKEVEYEIVRDRYDNCIAVCNMENIDPLGVHTGESIVVAPSQTLNDDDYFMLRDVAFKVVRKLGIVGECNIQYALDPDSGTYYIIEVNARLSRSSALASKATGYPLAYLAAKLSLGWSLLDIKNCVTKVTSSCAEPSLDYCVVKVPRWDLRKFPGANVKIGSAMKSVGEVMAISRSFEEAFQKALRMADDSVHGFEPLGGDGGEGGEAIEDDLADPSYLRMRSLATAFYRGMSVDRAWELSKIDKWFLKKMKKIVDMILDFEKLSRKGESLNSDNLHRAKRRGFSDAGLAKIMGQTEMSIRGLRKSYGVGSVVKRIDTVAAEFPCDTNYLYTTYNGDYNDLSWGEGSAGGAGSAGEVGSAGGAGSAGCGGKVIVIGSGVYRIGSSVEFDWCAVNCVRRLRTLGYETIMINYNPETVSTDYDEVDKLYFDEITVESVMDIYEKENPLGVVLSMGGQVANNIAMALHRMGVRVLGTSPERVDEAENRFKFSRMLDSLGVDQPRWKELTDIEDAVGFCEEVGYPCLVRPSYVLSGAAMNVAYCEEELREYLGEAVSVSPEYPVVVSKFIMDAKEIEFDGVAVDGDVRLAAVSEHIENAGVHSGDATLVLPAQDLTDVTIGKIKMTAGKIAKRLDITGPFNMQFIAKDDKIKVIECNLRVSRSFPFASKVFDCNFIEYSTDLIMGVGRDRDFGRYWESGEGKIGVKVAQFSFNRLDNADMKLGVEMRSTGEVACFGKNKEAAYLKALMSSRFGVCDRGVVVVSIGGDRFKKEFFDSFTELYGLKSKFKVVCTRGTGRFYGGSVPVMDDEEIMEIMRGGGSGGSGGSGREAVALFINVSDDSGRTKGGEGRGRRLRRCAVDSGVPLITNIKCAKLYVKSVMGSYDDYLAVGDCDMVDSKVMSVSERAMIVERASENGGDSGSGGRGGAGFAGEGVSIEGAGVSGYFKGKSVYDVDMFNRANLRALFGKAMNFKHGGVGGVRGDELAGKIVGFLFLEPSTRTLLSFKSSVLRLGGKVLDLDISASSVEKGESIEDTLRMYENYVDCLVIRFNDENRWGVTMKVLQKVITKIPVINAGWGSESHPTQALTDVLTIREERGTVSGTDIVIAGDLARGRTVKSLLKLLVNYRAKFRLVAARGCELDSEVLRWLAEVKNVDIKMYDSSEFSTVLNKCNVVYMTRLQKERGSRVVKGYPKLSAGKLKDCRDDLVIMHPLPRGEELSEDVDRELGAAYFRQAEYGLWVRMALLSEIL